MDTPNLRPLDERGPLIWPESLTIARTFSDPTREGGALIVSAGLKSYTIVQHEGHVIATCLLTGHTASIHEGAPIADAFAPVLDSEGRECFDITPIVKHRRFSARLFQARMRELMGREEADCRDAGMVFDLDDAVEFVNENVGIGDLTYSVLDDRADFYDVDRNHVDAVHVLTLTARAVRKAAGGPVRPSEVQAV